MRKRALSVLAAVVLLFSTVTAVGARGSFGFSGGVSVGSVSLTGVGTGVGAFDLSVTLAAPDATFTGICSNKGKNEPTGVNTSGGDFELSKVFTPDESGRIVIGPNDMVLDDPKNDNGDGTLEYNELDICKNKNWVFTVTEANWGVVVVTFVHDNENETVEYYDCRPTSLDGAQCAGPFESDPSAA